MSNLILPQKWTRQPQVPVEIDWGSPLVAALGLTEVWYPRNGLASKTLIRGFTPTAYVPSAVAVGYSENGAGARFLSNTQNNGIAIASSADDIFPDLTQASILVMRKSADTVLRASTLFGAGFTVGSNNRIILHAPYSDGITWFEYGDNTTTNKISIGGTVKTTNTEKFALIAGPSKGREIWRNGVKVIGDTSKNAARTSNTNPFRIGSVWDNSAVPSDIETVSLVIIGKKEWPDWAIKTLSDNPWQIFKAPARRLWVGAAGGTDTPVNPGVGSIAITGYAPSIAQTANQAVAPDVGNIIITGYAPTISQPQAVNPGVGSLTITGYAPTVTQNVDVPVNPGVGTIAITGYAPTVAQSANQSITPDAGNITITGYAPSVDQSANQDVTPDAGLISITGYAPTVEQAAGSPSLTPGVGTITITGYAPTVEQSSPLRLGGFEYSNKVYIKRNKKIYIFDSVEEADSYLEAEAKAEEIVQQSNKTSRLARKRAREKAFKSLAIEPVETIDIPALKTLVSQLQTGFELPQLIAKQDWQRVVEIYQQAMEMQDEEDLLLIL